MTQSISELNTARPEAVALFVSDLHLQADMPATAAAFLNFLKRHAIHARQLYLLGDIFEYWAGDDNLGDPFIQQVVQALKHLSNQGVELFWMAGNRDFLVGADFAAASGARLLPDPFILRQHGKSFLISHGDQLCTDDVAYQQFRGMVRQPEWQSAFLARPLQERKKMIEQMRIQSRQHQQQQTSMIMDVNPEAVDSFVNHHQAQILIHGHTHRPATHHIDNGLRVVLSDWDCDHEPARGDWLALDQDNNLRRYHFDGNLEQEIKNRVS